MRIAPPEYLRLPEGLVSRLVIPLWGLLMVVAVCAQLVGTWRGYEQYYTVDAAFADLGLRAEHGDDGLLQVNSTPGVEQVASVPPGSLIYSINGVNPGLAPSERYAELLAGPDGGYVAVTLGDREGTNLHNHYLVRSELNRAQAQPFSHWLMDAILTPLLGLIAAMVGLYASALLIFRRSDDPVAIILAIGLVGLVLTGDQPLACLFWLITDSGIAGEIYVLGYLIAFVPLAVALPAFPDNVYQPRWSGWLALIAPLAGLMIYAGGYIPNLHPAFGNLFSEYALIPLVVLALVASAIRFRNTPPGREKQQLKWAAVGFIFGLGAIIAAELLLASSVTRDPAYFGLWAAAVVLRAVGSILIPLGVVMSVLGLRLNDADSAVGRSAGYALITLLIGAVWAGSTTWINKAVGDAVAPAVATGISTMLAAAIFVPTRERIMKWMEARFQPALVKMRGLPAKLGPWRHDHDPVDLARGTLLAVVNGVQAKSAALVLTVDGNVRVLATFEASEDDVLNAIGSDDEANSESLFPLRLTLEDLLGPVGLLLLGPRTDGASYSSDERSAVKLVKGPLAEALRATSRRASRNLILTEILTAVDARVARLEALRGTN